MEFQPFPKMARLTRECIITEKIDGTNAQIYIVQSLSPEPGAIAHRSLGTEGDLSMFAGSRTRWLTPNQNGSKGDNFGFAGWVQENAEELFKLGPGRHFGEWWGAGIQRRYGLTEKRFSLFNTSRWVEKDRTGASLLEGQQEAPACCHVVPELYRGPFHTATVTYHLVQLRDNGSVAAPGFMDPEGVITFHVAAGIGFKTTIKDDESPKSKAA